MQTRAVTFVVLALLAAGCRGAEREIWVAGAPAGDAYTAVDRAGRTVLPNGRLLTPRGRGLTVAPHPYGLTLSPDGGVAVTANSGVRPFSISIIRDVAGANPSVQQVPEGAKTDEGVLAAVFMGLAIAPDGGTLYVGGGQEGTVILFDLASGERIGEIDANGTFWERRYEDSYIGDLVLSRDGRTLYAVDQTNFRLIIVDVAARRLVASVRVGRYPFGVTLTPDETRVYVANVGMYEYAVLEGVDREAEPPRLGVSFPPFAHGSRDAREGVEFDGYTARGLGDPNAPEAFSVWGIDVTDPAAARVVSRIKTGYLVGEEVEGFPTVGGSSPNSLVSTDDRVFVSNGNNDGISVIDTRRDTVISDIRLQLDPRLGRLRGHIPFGLAIAPDGTRLYVAEAGINAVAVVDLETYEVLGHIPVGWFPSKLAVTPDGSTLIVANAKGYGSGPNGGPAFERDPRGSFVGNLMNGFVSVIDIPEDADLAAETRQVVANNFIFEQPSSPGFADRRDNPIPLYPGEGESPIKHLVFITKENRTYDEIFGQVEGGRGEPSLARYGEDVTFSNRDTSATVEDATVMPNHMALARRFGIGDNFYCDSDVSADGHRWLVGVYPNEWVEASAPASYGDGRRLRLGSTAPGVLGFVGASVAIYPEDYNEAGSIWDHLDRFGIDFFNFGLGFEFAGGIERQDFKYTGIRLPINYPMPGPLFDRTSRKFATFNTSIPDQFRVDMFIEEFEERWVGAGKTMPPLITMMLPNDHGARERPADGYPFVESYMADNDLALGRVVEYLSHTPYWKDMAIVVTEDDPQGGVDHVDAHRSVLMVISPYAKRDYVAKAHYSFGSIMKTFWHVLGIPYLNQYDAGATDLADFFTDAPDFAPYTALPPDPRVFDPQRALDPLDEDFNWEALSASPEMDDVEVMQAWAREFDARRETARRQD
jgi:YVTN family beta-propeller protein